MGQKATPPSKEVNLEQDDDATNTNHRLDDWNKFAVEIMCSFAHLSSLNRRPDGLADGVAGFVTAR